MGAETEEQITGAVLWHVVTCGRPVYTPPDGSVDRYRTPCTRRGTKEMDNPCLQVQLSFLFSASSCPLDAEERMRG